MTTSTIKPFHLIYPDSSVCSKEVTYCVLGVPRGGTSMCAGLLQQLDINMGVRIDNDNIEDKDFLFHGGNRELFSPDCEERPTAIERVNSLIEFRNNEYSEWGWKDPISSLYIRDIFHKLRNPRLIVIMRDPSAVALREFKENKIIDPTIPDDRILSHMKNAIDQDLSITFFLHEVSVPSIIISYERSLRAPEQLVDGVADFLKKELASETRDQLINYIQPGRDSAEIYGK